MTTALATHALAAHKRSFSSPEMGALGELAAAEASPIRSHASERNLEQMGARLGDREEQALLQVRTRARDAPRMRRARRDGSARKRLHPTPLIPARPPLGRLCCAPPPSGRLVPNSTRARGA